MREAIYRFADDVPVWIAIPFRAVFFTVALACFGIYLAGAAIYCAAAWWWEQVRG